MNWTEAHILGDIEAEEAEMTDDLVKRLRDYEEFEQGRDGQIVCQKSEIAVEAADRIEALERDKKFILEERDRTFALMLARIEALTAKLDDLQDRLDAANKARAHVMKIAVKKQAKLAKAVEALRYYAGRTTYRLCDDCPVQVHSSADLSGPARTTLAEIESSEAVTLEGEKG
jgi:hypothetical protein